MVHWCYPPHIGGVETLLSQLCEKLASNDVRVHVVTGCRKTDSLENGVHVHANNILSGYREKQNPVEAKEFKSYMTQFCLKQKIDLIHAHNFHRHFRPDLSRALSELARELEIPMILQVHNPLENDTEKKLICELHSDKILCVSRWVASQVKEHATEKNKVGVLYNGIDTRKFRPNLSTDQLRKTIGVDESKKIIIAPSRFVRRSGVFHERKNLILLLESLTLLKKKRDDFVVAFTGKDEVAKDKIKKAAIEQGLGENTVFAPVGFDEMPSLYNLSDIVVLPSTDEAFGMVYIEGMACEKPVIGCRSGGVPEVIEDGKTGFLVDEKNPSMLAEKISELLDDEGKRKRFGEAGRKRVTEKFSMDVISRQLINEYEKLLQSK